MAAERLRLRGIAKVDTSLTVVVAPIQLFIFFVEIPIINDPSQTEGGVVFLLAYTIPYLFFGVFVVAMEHRRNKRRLNPKSPAFQAR